MITGPMGIRAVGNITFNPFLIGGLVGWFDMQDTTKFTQSGGFVQSITNKATSVTWNTANTVLPTYNATGINSFPAMSFNGSSQGIKSTTDTTLLNAIGGDFGYTLLAVINMSNISNRMFFGVANSASANGFKCWGANTNGSVKWSINGNTTGGTQANVFSTANADSNNNVYAAWAPSTTTASLRINNGSEDPSGTAESVGTLTCNNLCIGCRPRSTNDLKWQGFVGEIIIYNNSLSTADITVLTRYLGNKWNISVS